MHKATLRLFKAIQVENHVTKSINSKFVERALKKGYIIGSDIMQGRFLLDEVEETLFVEPNATFFKSWQYIKDTSQEELFFHQLLHYITTYGFRAVEQTVYVPYADLSIPELTGDVPLVYIKGVTSDELLDAIIKLGSGVALAENTIADIMTIVQYNAYDEKFVSQIKNRELQAKLWEVYGIIPSSPLEFLRYWILKTTGETLLIKNSYLIQKIQEVNSYTLDSYIPQAPKALSSIFLRYKPLFLAMRRVSNNKAFFNKLRRQAKTTHKALPEDYLNNVTMHIKQDTFDCLKLYKALETASVFRKIRLANALGFRAFSEPKSIVYKVRNGRGWATDFTTTHKEGGYKIVYDLVLRNIVSTLKVEGKTYYIPKGVHYALPATEKQFTGFIPSGSYVEVPKNMVVGVHWYNVEGKQIDLDLSTMSLVGKVGWNTGHRGQDILYSGDITDAPKPNGATEAMYLSKGIKDDNLLLVNYYNYLEDLPVKAKLFVAREAVTEFPEKYMVNPNHILMHTTLDIKEKNNILGLITTVDEKIRFYFSQSSVGLSNVCREDENTKHHRDFLKASTKNIIDLAEVLVQAGATVTTKNHEGCIDLSPQALTKTSILNLLQP